MNICERPVSSAEILAFSVTYTLLTNERSFGFP